MCRTMYEVTLRSQRHDSLLDGKLINIFFYILK